MLTVRNLDAAHFCPIAGVFWWEAVWSSLGRHLSLCGSNGAFHGPNASGQGLR